MKKKILIISCIVIALVTMIVLYLILFNTNKETVIKYNYNDKDYFIIKGDYKGKYNIKYTYSDRENAPSNFDISNVLSYNEYIDYINKFNIDKAYNDKDMNYIVIGYCSIGTPNIEVRIADVEIENNKANVYIWEHVSGISADTAAYVVVIPVDKSVTEVKTTGLYTEEEFNNIKKYGEKYDPNEVIVYKPIIYLYPTKEENISVKLLNDKLITHSYPKYEGEWNVLAKSNGDLIDLKTNRKLYALYYENNNIIDFNHEDGFIVSAKDTIKFLEEKLEILGLNERESEEFIIYWLPKLENNKYNYIRFATMDEINENMPLEINPKPDTVIRVLMTYKPLKNKINIKEQELSKIKRSGYTIVEWGGTKLN